MEKDSLIIKAMSSSFRNQLSSSNNLVLWFIFESIDRASLIWSMISIGDYKFFLLKFITGAANTVAVVVLIPLCHSLLSHEIDIIFRGWMLPDIYELQDHAMQSSWNSSKNSSCFIVNMVPRSHFLYVEV